VVEEVRMVPLTSLWLPVVVSAVIVFVASSILHMVLPFHRNDIRRLPTDKEDQVLDLLRRASLPPGDYGAPHPGSPAGMREPAYIAKVTKGPVAFMTIAPGRPPTMAPNLVQWFVYCAVVSMFTAYVTGVAAGPGAAYMTVFRVASVTTFMGYSLALAQHSIWYRRDWGTTMRSAIDGLIYGLLTGGVFGWLWPS
jgi:hypothetical protein